MKQVNHTRLKIQLTSTTRSEVRAEMFRHWTAEEPGTPTLRNTYRYDVEKLPDGALIYLTRPTRLNKGADFVIYCDGFTKFKNGNNKPPKHDDLFAEIRRLSGRSSSHRSELKNALQRIWNCEESEIVLNGLSLFKNCVEAYRALLLSKWFFIEQDVTYWTESGRHMLMTGIEENT